MKNPSVKQLAQPTTRRSSGSAARQSARQPLNTEWDAAFAQARAEIDAFAEAHPGFDEVAPQILHLIETTTLSLEDAYAVAVVQRAMRKNHDKQKRKAAEVHVGRGA